MTLTLTKIDNLLKEAGLLKEYVYKNNWYYNLPLPVELEIKELSYDSRKVTPDTLFFCKGLNFKEEYLEKAIEAGLEYYISETPYEVNSKLGIIVTDIRIAMALISMNFYDLPQEKLTVIGFTGTKGKTTAAYFTKFILDEATDNKTAMLSTMNTTLDGVNYFKSALTTPESLDLYKMMAEAVSNKMTHLIMEVSSQAYKLNRVYGLTFDVGIFLNISPDHIGPIEHPTFDDYYYCKRRLIENSKRMVLNTDTKDYILLKELTESKNIPYYSYSSTDKEADYTWETVDNSLLDFTVHSTHEDSLDINETYTIKLMGDFNKDNALASLITTKIAGANKEAAKKGLANTLVPGRMEHLKHPNGANVFVDYAHNYSSLKNLLTFAKQAHPMGKIITVIGSTGDKGISRRTDFGQVLSELTDVAILTADDPGSENPKDIAMEISAAINNPKVNQKIIVDRVEAIQTALSLAEKNDSVIIAGKGQDKYQKIKGVDTPYVGDYSAAESYIETLK
ncbi:MULTISPECIES: UDP-N-acetylmuramoyl-L-alanyl-D-glutamate--L-lysine ligase [Vagococcus]|uniref:UDP-N-acetylmuramyl-tripeptide synthetase n=1 Tax=Vagococcus fluvialis bH819 TaxID=1255619 RepID=A0A1X6WQ55_9ENTE|nr:MULTISPECIES: UDP-N-acetylmuramoyl-L-alanyl-D-glutamate--L-lysine ligase [Vagococcus]SLM85776.1 UDP-N-acetylmuramoylalanyl-D-glutamate--L-lysine ligase [Vagococcus fluvialis bH819]HCM90198.1 UDP-N-acetylmuramoyl-L-alanyl-D-glutamate--L-lysine ligase [Vagococcus sp.]